LGERTKNGTNQIQHLQIAACFVGIPPFDLRSKIFPVFASEVFVWGSQGIACRQQLFIFQPPPGKRLEEIVLVKLGESLPRLNHMIMKSLTSSRTLLNSRAYLLRLSDHEILNIAYSIEPQALYRASASKSSSSSSLLFALRGLHAASEDRTTDRNHALDVVTRKLFSTIDSEQPQKSKIFKYIRFTRQVPRGGTCGNHTLSNYEIKQ
jgi:hypothetical protein